jgi:hypothetical protein
MDGNSAAFKLAPPAAKFQADNEPATAWRQWSLLSQSKFAKRHEPFPSLIPEGEPHASEALTKRQPADARELRMIAQDLRQAIERDATGQVMHVMHADVAGKKASGGGNS